MKHEDLRCYQVLPYSPSSNCLESPFAVDGEPPGEDGYTPDSIDCEHCAICHFPGILHILLSIVDAEQGFPFACQGQCCETGMWYDTETAARLPRPRSLCLPFRDASENIDSGLSVQDQRD